ncbi:MAG: exosortase [Phycisphaeraceae bacterium]|nr:MAG: exosortase [Phycisphaeraceae bacterium]
MWFGFVTPARAIMLGVCSAAFIAVFWRWFYAQHLFSQAKMQDWGHAYLIPLISGYMLWVRRQELARTPPSSFWPGLAPLVLGIAAYFFAVVGIKNHMAQGLAMILALFGLCLMLLGPAVMRVIFLPIAFLAFGVTLSERIMISIEFQLQQIAAQGGWVALGLLGPIFGFSAVLTGNTIEIIERSGVSHPMGIAEACSGMRMVIAFVALAGAVALLGTDRWWQRAALMMLAIPVALFMNIVRIAVLGVGTLVDPNIATGEIHIFIGTVMLIPALGLFLLGKWALDRLFVEEGAVPAKGAKGKAKAKPDASPAYLGIGWPALRSPAFIAALTVMVVWAGGMTWAIQAWGLYLRKLPIQAAGGRLLSDIRADALPSWEGGVSMRESAEVEETLGTTNYLTRAYAGRTPETRGTALALHAAYYTGMIDTVPHVPERCLVGGGWTIESGPYLVPLPLDLSRWPVDPRDERAVASGVRRARLERTSDAPGTYVRLPAGIEEARMQITSFRDPRGNQMYSGYFFVANGGFATTAVDVRRLAFDLTADYAYYMKVQVSGSGISSPEELAARAADLLNELLPELMRCVPDWLEVQSGDYPPDNPRRKAGAGS